jgi:hypothetical protein
MSFQKYPVGLQDFSEIITRKNIYVDKTRFIHNLLLSQKYYFLSRPRRFGKSLLISTLYYLFKGKKELFKGLYIYDKWNFEEYPVIRMSFSSLSYEKGGLEQTVKDALLDIAKSYDLSIEKEKVKDIFSTLIKQLHRKFDRQVVVLIDEYDKPIIDYLDAKSIHQAIENRSILKSFYSILKDADQDLKMVFITGISKFSQVSIFSDLTLEREYNELCGISQKELEAYFPQELATYDREKIKLWYNGYRWDTDGVAVYNPFSLLRFFAGGGKFQNFWYATGTPTFLMELSKSEHFYSFTEITADLNDLQNFSIENINLVPVLFQTGYLTLVGYDEVLNNAILSFPNLEVRESYLRNLADLYIQSQTSPSKVILSDILKSFKAKHPEGLKIAINKAFKHIPYPLWQKENEQFYQAIVHLLFSLLGVYIHSEVHTKDGRADAIINIDEGVFCLEFKLDQSAESAVQQVKDKQYLAAYEDLGKPMHIIGINFSREKKEIEELIWEEVHP